VPSLPRGEDKGLSRGQASFGRIRRHRQLNSKMGRRGNSVAERGKNRQEKSADSEREIRLVVPSESTWRRRKGPIFDPRAHGQRGSTLVERKIVARTRDSASSTTNNAGSIAGTLVEFAASRVGALPRTSSPSCPVRARIGGSSPASFAPTSRLLLPAAATPADSRSTCRPPVRSTRAESSRRCGSLKLEG